MARKKSVDLPPDKAKPDPLPFTLLTGEGVWQEWHPYGKRKMDVPGSLPASSGERPPRHPRDLLSILGFPPLDPTLSEAEKIGRLWQLWVLRIGLYLPAAIAVVVAFLLLAFPSLGLWLGMDPKHIKLGVHGPFEIVLGIALMDALSCWPFIALGRAAKRRIKFMWPDVRAARPAIIGALIGLSALHGWVFFGVGSEMAMDDPDAGAGSGYAVGFLAAGGGWIFGGLGWLCGSIIGRMLRRPATDQPAESDI
jgi:hypothetical protein